LRETVAAVKPNAPQGPQLERVRQICREQEQRFDDALADDLDVTSALAAVGELVAQLNQLGDLQPDEAKAALESIEGIDAVLDVLDKRARSGLLEKARVLELSKTAGPIPDGALDQAAIESAIGLRQAAKGARDFAKADAIRAELSKRGVAIEDTAQGVRWKLV
jgi:cysteinyl-tRNA synthetase